MSADTMVTRAEIAQRNAGVIRKLRGDPDQDVYDWAHLRHLGFKSPELLDRLWSSVQGEWEITLPARQELEIRTVGHINAAVAAALHIKGTVVED